MKLSIIIPIYNIEKYLSECLDSIVCQDCANIEVILVDDGSTDNSGKIADDYAQKYSFIQVIHQKNQGVSVARNNGLLNAKGEYIWFVDGDDWIEQMSIAKIIELCQTNIDIIFIDNIEVLDGKMINMNSKYNRISSLMPSNFTNDFRELLLKNIITPMPWDKVIKKNILIDNSILFEKEYRVAEDFYFNFFMLQHIKSYCYIGDICYFYRKDRLHSLSTDFSFNETKQLVCALKKSVDYINYGDVSENIKYELLLFSTKAWFVVIRYFVKFNYQERIYYYEILHEIYSVFLKKISLEDICNCNRGARFLHKIVDLFGWRFGYYVYGYSIAIRRSKFGFWLLDKLGK